MSRPSTPEPIYQARRAGTLQRLIGEGELPDRAERLVALLEAETARDGLERDGRYRQDDEPDEPQKDHRERDATADGRAGLTGRAGVADLQPAAAKNLTGTFDHWEPVDDGHGHAYFAVTNNGSAAATAECTVQVRDDFGDFGFDSLVGETVEPGKTITGRMALSVGKGSFLINSGSVTNC